MKGMMKVERKREAGNESKMDDKRERERKKKEKRENEQKLGLCV